MREAAMAIPAANRYSARIAFAILDERLSVVNDDYKASLSRG